MVGSPRMAWETLGQIAVFLIVTLHQAAGSGADGTWLAIAAAAAIHVELRNVDHGDGELRRCICSYFPVAILATCACLKMRMMLNVEDPSKKGWQWVGQ